MRFRFSLMAAVVLSIFAASFAGVSRADDRADIEARIRKLNADIASKNLDAIMSNYEPSEEIVIFDVIPPTQYVGAAAWRKDWQGALAPIKGPIKIDIRELNIRNAGDLGVAHYIQHWTTEDPSGKPAEYSFRITDSLVKRNGSWLIAHEHLSLPANLDTGKVDLSGK